LSQQPVPETCSARRNMERAAPGFLFGLAPDGVFRALPITRQAVSSYLTFSPLPRPCGRGGLFSVALSVEMLSHSSRVYLSELRGITPSGVRTFLPRLFEPEAILHPAGINSNLILWGRFATIQSTVADNGQPIISDRAEVALRIQPSRCPVRKLPQPSQELCGGHGCHSLHVKPSRFEKRNTQIDLKLRRPYLGRMRDNLKQSVIRVIERNTYDRDRRVLAVKPRSASQTSPRLGRLTRLLPSVQHSERFGCGRRLILLRPNAVRIVVQNAYFAGPILLAHEALYFIKLPR
jgi:hypothetical protein